MDMNEGSENPLKAMVPNNFPLFFTHRHHLHNLAVSKH
jgi:hypothetical protein